MTYGKNQFALLKFLEKHPNRWHSIKRRKAIDAARGLERRGVGVDTCGQQWVWVRLNTPQMLQEQG